VTRHREHGDQFKIESFTSELPASVYGIRKYLGSASCPHRKVYANKIVDAFATDTFRVLSEESAACVASPESDRSARPRSNRPGTSSACCARSISSSKPTA